MFWVNKIEEDDGLSADQHTEIFMNGEGECEFYISDNDVPWLTCQSASDHTTQNLIFSYSYGN